MIIFYEPSAQYWSDTLRFARCGLVRIHCPTNNRNVCKSVRPSVRPSATFANIVHNFLLREPILSLFVLPARSRNFAHFCQNRFSILVPRRPWERSQGLLYRPVRFPVPAKRFANFVTALSLLLRAPEPSWRWAATIGGGFAAFWVMPGPPPE